MAFNLKPTQKREVADKILAWLKEHDITTCDNSYKLLSQCSEDIHEPLFNCWKGYELLRILSRIELNSPNGRKGFTVLDSTPLFLPISPAVPICDITHCPILTKLKRQFPALVVSVKE